VHNAIIKLFLTDKRKEDLLSKVRKFESLSKDCKLIHSKNKKRKEGKKMKKTGFLLILIGFLCFLAAPSYAVYYTDTTWTDWYFPEDVPLYMEQGDTEFYTHDLGDAGFNPYRDTVDSYYLKIFVTDDYLNFDRDWWQDSVRDNEEEYLSIKTSIFYPEGTYEVDLLPIEVDDNFLGLLSLNFLENLAVTLKVKEGDLYFWSSELVAEGRHVPEPATMLLLGCSLLGLAGIGRKKFFKK
jgi:hypothetical protein